MILQKIYFFCIIRQESHLSFKFISLNKILQYQYIFSLCILEYITIKRNKKYLKIAKKCL